MKKVKFGLLACGNIANKMARAVTGTDNVELYACGARSLERAESFAAKYNIPKAYGSYEELLSDPELELVYVSTPHSLHYQYIKMSLEHGKNVICEKPFTTSGKQAAELFALAREKGLFLMECMWTRFLPAVRELKKMLDEGEIGELLTLQLMNGQDLRKVHRLMAPELAGGALLDMGIYSVTIADLYFGDGIKNISSTVRMSDKGVDLMNIIILDYGNGRTAAVGTSAIAAMENTAYIMGSEGYAILKSFSGMTEFTIVKGSKATTYTYPNALRGNGFEHELSEAASCILNGKIESEIMPGKKTIYMMELLDKIRGQWGMVYPFEK